MAIELNKDVAEHRDRIDPALLRRDAAHAHRQRAGTREVLDYFLKEIAPSVYNQAIAEAQQHLQAKVMDLDVDCHEREFDHWKTAKPAK